MKLSIINILAQRTGAPKVSAPLVNYLLPGNIVEIERVVWGDQLDGNGIWYQSSDGYFYWSGGFAEINFSMPGLQLETFPPGEQISILKQLREQAHIVFKDNIAGYLGCGFGYKNYDEQQGFAFLVYVDQKMSLDNPALSYKVVEQVCFWGFKIQTDVMEVEKAIHHTLEVSPPYIGGGITVHVNSKTHIGTRSIGVKRKSAGQQQYDHFLLASYHVLLDNLIGKQNDYSGTPEQNCRFPINNSIPGDHKITEGCYNVNYDYAAIRLGPNERIINKIGEDTITDFFQVDEIFSLKNKTVASLGYISKQLLQGRVKSVFNKITLSPHNQEFEDVIFTEKLSTEGDSGAPVIEQETKKLVGFIIGGNDKDLSYVLPFYNLNYEKKFEIS
jgi:hypothetical protein